MRLLALDPGGTTGYAVFVDGKLTAFGEMERYKGLKTLIRADKPDAIVAERFALYASKAAALIGNEMVPAQVIGVARFLAEENDINIFFQPASTIHLGESTLNPTAERYVNALIGPGGSGHARDAIAHGVYALLFGSLKDQPDREQLRRLELAQPAPVVVEVPQPKRRRRKKVAVVSET
jgi:hypothetical protein